MKSIIFVKYFTYSLQSPSKSRFNVWGYWYVLEKENMKVISHKICFWNAIAPIINCEERYLPLFRISFREVSNDTNSILVIVQKWTWMRICRIAFNNPIRLRRYLRFINNQRLKSLRFQLLLYILQMQFKWTRRGQIINLLPLYFILYWTIFILTNRKTRLRSLMLLLENTSCRSHYPLSLLSLYRPTIDIHLG